MVRFLASGVVFCTNYALILPAITMNREAVCGLEAHEHTPECYVQQQATAYQCQYGSHVHSDVCRDENGELICGYGDVVIHNHNEFCYDAEGALVCGLNEAVEHIHDESCYAQTSELVCTVPETPVHVHDETCQSAPAEPVLVCQKAEGEVHVHTDECYTQVQELVCELTEEEGHIHEDGCYQTVTELVCALSLGSGRSIALMSANAPEFTVEYYAHFPKFQYSSTKPTRGTYLKIMDTRGDGDGTGGSLPKHMGNTTNPGTERGVVYLMLEDTGMKNTDRVSPSWNQTGNAMNTYGTPIYEVMTVDTLTEVYNSEPYTYASGISIKHLDTLVTMICGCS